MQNIITTSIRYLSIFMLSLLLTNCGGSSTSTSGGTANSNTEDEFSRSEYKGLTFYYKNMPSSDYTLNQLTNAEFNTLNESQKLQVADKLLSTLFFGYPLKALQEKIDSGNFIDALKNGLDEETTDKAWLENYI